MYITCIGTVNVLRTSLSTNRNPFANGQTGRTLVAD